ncbi:hypothetical protein SVIOM74S_10040 [Streptomyces violarus]
MRTGGQPPTPIPMRALPTRVGRALVVVPPLLRATGNLRHQ